MRLKSFFTYLWHTKKLKNKDETKSVKIRHVFWIKICTHTRTKVRVKRTVAAIRMPCASELENELCKNYEQLLNEWKAINQSKVNKSQLITALRQF